MALQFHLHTSIFPVLSAPSPVVALHEVGVALNQSAGLCFKFDDQNFFAAVFSINFL